MSQFLARSRRIFGFNTAMNENKIKLSKFPHLAALGTKMKPLLGFHKIAKVNCVTDFVVRVRSGEMSLWILYPSLLVGPGGFTRDLLIIKNTHCRPYF